MPKQRMGNGMGIMGKASDEQRYHTSAFMVTINPNVRFPDPNNAEAEAMKAKLINLGDFLLTKKSLLSSFVYLNKTDKKTSITTLLSRDAHESKIIEISPDRDGGYEWGERDKKLHMHIQFIVKHRTYIQLNREYYKSISEALLGVPAKSIHVHFNGSPVNEGYAKYVNKGVIKAANANMPPTI